MPNQPRGDNPARAVRVEDELWAAAQTKAAETGTTVSAVIREALEWFVEDGSERFGALVDEMVATRDPEAILWADELTALRECPTRLPGGPGRTL